jgi:hypothetical protein
MIVDYVSRNLLQFHFRFVEQRQKPREVDFAGLLAW